MTTALCRGSLEDENRRLKKLPAEALLDNAALKGLRGKNVCGRWEALGLKPGSSFVFAIRLMSVRI